MQPKYEQAHKKLLVIDATTYDVAYISINGKKKPRLELGTAQNSQGRCFDKADKSLWTVSETCDRLAL